MKQLEDDDPTILMNIRMKKSLKKGIRLFAAEKGITITELATKALNEYMKKNT
jgi:predicted HicB family RNase H-like nuclease